jgi:O-antigen ligase
MFFLAFIFTSVHSIGLLGDFGRNLGFLNYLFLSLIAAYTALRVSFLNCDRLYQTSILLLSFLSVYGVFQHFGLDLFRWNNPYNHIILTTGNPDFAASLLALLITVSSLGFFIPISKSKKVLLMLLIVIAFVDIYWSRAIQGLVASAAGIGFFLLVVLWKKSKKFAWVLLAFELVIGSLSILGTLRIGPLSKYLYKASVNDRGYDWRAAVAMFKSHPLFGVGVDRYGAYFAQYRDQKYPLIYGYTQTVTNAHNVILEIFATAGIFVGILYLALLGFIAYRGFVALRRSTGTQRIMVAAFASGWIVFIAQSVISVDSLVISTWGWVLGGAIVGLSVQGNSAIPSHSSSHKFYKNKLKKMSKGTDSLLRSIAFSILLVLLLLIIVPMYRNETGTFRFLITQSPSDATGKEIYRKIAKETFNHPLLNPKYKVDIATTLAKNNYPQDAINFFKQTIREDSRNIDAYILLSGLYEQLKKPKDSIPNRKQLALLDPYGAENLLSLENDYLQTGDRTSAIVIRDSIITMAPGTDVAKRAAGLITK